MVKSKNNLWTISGKERPVFLKIWMLLVGQKVDYFLYCQKVFFDFKGSFLSFVFWSKAKMIFGQFRAVLLLGPSKSGCSLWVKKWISFLDWCDGAAAAGEAAGGKHFCKCLMVSKITHNLNI